MSVTPRGPARISPFLFDWHARDLSLTARTGQAGTLTHASQAWGLTSGGVYVPFTNNEPRYAAVSTPNNGVFDACGILLEGARTNSALGSCSFADGTYWATQGTFTVAAARSCIAGQVAYQHANTGGSNYRYQLVGTFVNGQSDVAYAILENVNAATSAVRIFDSTASLPLVTHTFTWATLSSAITGAGSGGAINLGNGRWILWVSGVGISSGTGAAGNARRIDIFPTGTVANSLAAIIHHGQLEPNAAFPSSPMVTVGSTFSRSADAFSFPWNALPGTLTVYAKWINRGTYADTVNPYRILQVGTTGGFLALFEHNGGANLTAALNNGSQQSSASATPTINEGDLVEARAVMTTDWKARLGVSVNGGAETVVDGAVITAPPTSWPAQTLYVNQNASAAQVGSRSLLSIRGTLGIQSLDYMRGVALT